MAVPEPVELRPVPWPEIGPGDDLVALLCAAVELRDGDVLVVTSKVVSKAEGRLVVGDRADAIEGETRRVVARRGATVIAETRHGLVLAAAGVDASNTPTGTALLLPLDPDASARALRRGVYAATGRNVGIVVSDTAGRAWRVGQTDLAVGCAGLQPLDDLAGTTDTFGNALMVTAPATADELASAADLVKGKTSGCPVALVRGLSALVLPPYDDGPGARSLARPPAEDLFGLGTREAVAAAAHRVDTQALSHFAHRTPLDAGPFDGLLESWLGSLSTAHQGQVRADVAQGPCPEQPSTRGWALRIDVREGAEPDVLVSAGRLLERAATLAASHRLGTHDHPGEPASPGWLTVASRCWRER